MNENVGEQKLNCPLYEGPSEPSVRNSKAGANEFTINNYPDPRIKYHFRFQKADGSFVAGTTCMYWTVDFFHYDSFRRMWTAFFGVRHSITLMSVLMVSVFIP